MLFLSEADHEALRDELDQVLRRELPREVGGYSTHFARHGDGTTWMVPAEDGPVAHRVRVLTIRGFFQSLLGFDPTGPIRAADWVSVPQQILLSLTVGRVFHDGLGQLEPLRKKLCYYPDDVWLYLLSAQWMRISQEEPFMGRCGQVGDDLGSRLIAGRLVRDLMGLCFLMERCYAPYVKWFGTAFAQLDCAADLQPVLTQVLSAETWHERQTHLTTAYEYAARKHNALGITEPVEPKVSPFFDRPFLVIHGERFADALRAQIEDKEVLALPVHLGSVDQFTDSTDAQKYLDRIKGVYE
jgi:hypothetical protein